MESALQKIENEYISMQRTFFEEGMTKEVQEYAQKVLMKARAIEYALTGQIYDRIIRINRHLERHHCITATQMRDIFMWGFYRQTLLDFCGIRKLKNGSYVSDEEHRLIIKIMQYGVKDDAE